MNKKMTKIELIRKTLKLTQKKLGNYLKTTDAAISYYEKRKRVPSATFLANLMKFLKMVKPPLSITIEQVLDDYK